ncbi:hypothetical protein CLIB1444_06S05094 [[Candida] jaroonii]|uniref:Uncharacterized protein n=1 Tax=[Candida] jaroonii TaxID=467808 RepID=A0ACA9Y9B3_9ASCO|nr:hypothetical protein CLIB1444_06S05094 [[Candida] jaroonii]
MNFTFFLFLISSVFAAAPAVNFKNPAAGYNNTKITSTINIHTGNVTGYYYANQGYFTTGDVGYFGFQPRGGIYLQHLTYSVFGSGPYSNHPNCGNGADGGDGVSCAAEYHFDFNKNYTFVQERIAHNEATGENTWQGSVINEETGDIFIVANYTTPAKYGLLKNEVYCFDEFYPYNSLGNTPPEEWYCTPPSSYVQYAPVLYDADGNKYPTTFETFAGDYNKEFDECAFAQNTPNIRITKLNDYAAFFENGFLTP